MKAIRGVMARVLDRKGRPLYVVRLNGQVVYYRYHDMTPEERDIILRFNHEIEKRGLKVGSDGLEKFLNFEDDTKICG
jgi:hypothetical protein